MGLRNYEISVWQDYLPSDNGVPLEYYEEKNLAVIGGNHFSSDCRANNPKFRRVSNGEYELTFELYSRYFDKDELEFLDNPFIPFLVNERKIKLHLIDEDKWYDFIIKDIQENSENNSFIYTAKALFINELAKNGLDLVFDPELENSIGSVKELAEIALEGTDWSVSGDSELIQQTNIEPLYAIYLKEGITANKMFPSGDEETDVIEIRANTYIYAFYSDITNKNSLVQFLYREDGNYVIDTDTQAINNAETWLIDGVTYNGDIPSLSANTVFVSNEYRGKKYIRSATTEQNLVLGRTVNCYYPDADAEEATIRGFTINEYVSPTLVNTLITNPSDFTDDTGWKVENDNGFIIDFFPPFNIEDLGNSKLALKADLTTGQKIYNSGLIDNRKSFAETGIAKGEKYVLGVDYPEGDTISSSFIGQVGFYSLENGEYKLNDIIFDFSEPNATITQPYSKCFIAEAKRAVSYQEMLDGKLGFFIKATANGTYVFLKVDLFKYYTETVIEDEKSIETLIYPGGPINDKTVIQKIYCYYDIDENKDKTVPEDYKYLYRGPSEQTQYILQYDDTCEKRRSLKISKSNRFNIIQELCELFECWAEFVIEHESDGRIKIVDGKPIKQVIFKNYLGKDNFAGFKYGINSKSIQRTLDSEQIVSKIIVEENDNEFAIDGACSISRAIDNPTGELFFFDFRHYYTQGLLNYSELMNDLYLEADGSNWLGYYKKMRRLNDEREIIFDKIGALSNAKSNLSAAKQTYTLIEQESSDALLAKQQEWSKYPVTANINYSSTDPAVQEALQKVIEDDPEALAILTSIYTLQKQYDTNKALAESYRVSYEELETQYSNFEDRLNEIKESKAELNAQFYAKYSRFIQEGSWTSEDYLDDNLYYYDAAATLAQSASPKVTYTINVIDVSTQEGFENYRFDVGDKTYIEDTEFFGWILVNGMRTPVQEEIVVSEIIMALDDPSTDVIRVQNYKSKFEDMFQRINTAATTLQYQSGSFARAAAIVNNSGEIKAETLQQSFANNAFTLANSNDQTILWDESGITISSPKSPHKIVRLVNGGVYLTSDGGTTWSAAITGGGINANYINAGQIDTNVLRIINGAWPTYKWDSKGLSAYLFNLDKDGKITSINYDQYVRFDQYGIYGITGESEWIASSIEDVKNNADFALTWNGFILRKKDNTGYLELSTAEDFVIGTYITNENARFGLVKQERIKIGNIGTEAAPNYGIRIKDENDNTVLLTKDDGSLWLENRLNIETYTNNQVGIGKLDSEATKDEVHGGRVINASNQFVVYEDGHIVAESGSFKGHIEASSGSFKGHIVATSGQIGNLSIDDIESNIGTAVYDVTIESSGGIIFRNGVGELTLLCRVYKNGSEITTNLGYTWYKNDVKIEGAESSSLVVRGEENGDFSTYSCEVSVLEAGE